MGTNSLSKNEQKFERAIELFRSEDFSEALKIFLELHQISPAEIDKKTLFEWISACYAHIGEFDKSEVFYEKAIQTVSDPIWSKFLYAISFNKKGKFKESIELLDSIPDSYNDKYSVADKYYWLGLNYYYLDDNNNARKYFEQSYALHNKEKDPEGYAKLLYEYSMVLCDLDEDSKAMELYCELDKYVNFLSRSNRITLFYLRSMQFQNRGDYHKALSDSLNSLKLVKNHYGYDQEDINRHALLALRIYVELSEFKNALELAESIILPLYDDYAYWHYYYNLSISNYKLNNYLSALEYMEKFIETNKKRSLFSREEFYKFKLMMADAYFRTKRLKEAESLYTELIESNLTTTEDYLLIKDRLDKIRSS